jgi:hypothetical protein
VPWPPQLRPKGASGKSESQSPTCYCNSRQPNRQHARIIALWDVRVQQRRRSLSQTDSRQREREKATDGGQEEVVSPAKSKELSPNEVASIMRARRQQKLDGLSGEVEVAQAQARADDASADASVLPAPESSELAPEPEQVPAPVGSPPAGQRRRQKPRRGVSQRFP